jgi:citrate synthase
LLSPALTTCDMEMVVDNKQRRVTTVTRKINKPRFSTANPWVATDVWPLAGTKLGIDLVDLDQSRHNGSTSTAHTDSAILLTISLPTLFAAVYDRPQSQPPVLHAQSSRHP